MTPRRTAGPAAGLFLAAAVVTAQPPAQPPAQPAKASTAQPGEIIPATFRSYLVSDDRFPPKAKTPERPDGRDDRNRTERMHDLVTEYGLSPVVAVFVRSDPKDLADSGVVKLARALDANLRLADATVKSQEERVKRQRYRANKLAGFVQFLRVEGTPKQVTVNSADGKSEMKELDAEYPDDEKGEAVREDIRRLAKSAGVPNVPFGLAPVAGANVAAWGIKPEDAVTVVLYARYRVHKRWTFGATGPTDAEIATILAEVDAMIRVVGGE